ncbi:hypothetical protein PFISCL1PPCAC_3919, partial [Pristionchus fissidentatus]
NSFSAPNSDTRSVRNLDDSPPFSPPSYSIGGHRQQLADSRTPLSSFLILRVSGLLIIAIGEEREE